jgi:hypothetical protein
MQIKHLFDGCAFLSEHCPGSVLRAAEFRFA